jgi:cysteine desulfurase
LVTYYLDHAATTPVRSVAIETMTKLLADGLGNPSGAHRLARAATRVLDDARENMADALGAQPGEVVFTAGGTEADNLALFGVLEASGGVAVCSAIEHHAVIDPVEHRGGRVVAVNPDGQIDLEALAEALGADVSIVSVMLANNETGILQPLAAIADLVREHAPNAALHTDAVQAFSWIDLAEVAQVADMISVSAHKFGGPPGVGALVVRAGTPMAAQIRGGGQERGRRSGTQNVPGIAAMVAAATEMVAEREHEVARVGSLRDRLADGLRAQVSGVVESGVGADADRSTKTANVCHVCIENIESEALLFLLEKDDVLASAAASCSSGAMEPSHVLAAMGYSRELAFGSLRLSLGYPSTDDDIDAVLAALPPAVERLRECS